MAEQDAQVDTEVQSPTKSHALMPVRSNLEKNKIVCDTTPGEDVQSSTQIESKEELLSLADIFGLQSGQTNSELPNFAELFASVPQILNNLGMKEKIELSVAAVAKDMMTKQFENSPIKCTLLVVILSLLLLGLLTTALQTMNTAVYVVYRLIV